MLRNVREPLRDGLWHLSCQDTPTVITVGILNIVQMTMIMGKNPSLVRLADSMATT